MALRYIELFAGVGGFRLGIERAFYAYRGEDRRSKSNSQSQSETRSGLQPQASQEVSAEKGLLGGSDTNRYDERALCVFANEWDKYAAQTYNKNFGGRCENQDCGEHLPIGTRSGKYIRPNGDKSDNQVQRPQTQQEEHLPENNCRRQEIDTRDITTIPTSDIPDHDLLVGGFPCQAFSVAGKRRGFNETRGTLFFEIARILADKKPQHLLLENVKGLLSHDSGRTFQTILRVLANLGYRVEWQVLNSKDFGVPQNRERVFIIGHLGTCCGRKVFPIAGNGAEVTAVRATAGNRYSGDSQGEDRGAAERREVRIRRLTPVECERLQGFPDGWTAGVSDTQRYKQMGNAVTVNVIEAIVRRIYG